MYAIVEDSGTQMRVSEGDELFLDARELSPEAATLTLDRVMMVSDPEDESRTVIGTPWVSGARVRADILEEGRGPKQRVVKFKKRKGYKRERGHRQPYLKVKITDIETGS